MIMRGHRLAEVLVPIGGHRLHKQFANIVIGGAREERGMPSFKDVLDLKKTKAIEAFVLSRAEESARVAH